MTKILVIDDEEANVRVLSISLRSDGYDVVTAKALAPFPRTVTLCAPFVASNGLLVAFLGSGLDEALESAQREMGVHGMSLYRKISYRITGQGARRWICLIRKEG